MATAAMSSNGTAGEKSGPGAVNFGAERKRAAETVLEEVTALKGLRKVAKRHGNHRSSNPGLKLPPSAYASVAKANRCSTADIDELCCGRKDLYDVIRGKSEEAGGRDGPCHPVDDKGHIIFEPEKNLTPRFKMLTCVGTGTFGKVIMCWDRAEDKAVAVKVIRSEPKYAVAGKNEIAVLTTLRRHDPSNRWPFVRLQRWFEYSSGAGNSKHIVMVFDMLGPSLYDTMLRNRSAPFHIRDIRGYVRQILQSLAYMHGLGIVHTDIKPENLLHTTAMYVMMDVHRGAGRNSVSNRGVGDRGGDGDGDRAPKRLASSGNRKPLAAYQPSDGKVIVCDFGSAAFEDGVHARTVSTRNYRAPEIILQIGWSLEVDLWSVGCLIMEMVTGTTFFSTSCDREHLLMIKKVLGKDIPRGMAEKHHAMVPCSDTLVADESTVQAVPETGSLLSKKLLDRYFVLKVNQSMVASSQETKDLKSLVKKLLAWDPRDRGTAEAALAHPFFTRPTARHEG